MAKSVAVLIRDDRKEGLRMAVGLTLDDLTVGVFILGEKLELTEDAAMNIEALREMKATIYTDNPADSFTFMNANEMAMALIDYDAVITY